MQEVVDRLFISDLHALEQLFDQNHHCDGGNADKASNEVSVLPWSVVLSLGCSLNYLDLPRVIRRVSLPLCLDEVSTFLIPLWEVLIPDLEREFKEGKGVLIHCIHGQSRSASTIAAYLIRRQHLSRCGERHVEGSAAANAISLIRSARPNISINPSFLAQLHFYEESLVNPDAFCSMRTLLNWQYIEQTRGIIASMEDTRKFSANLIQSFEVTALVDDTIRYINRIVLCKNCKVPLVGDLDLIHQSLDSSAFLNSNMDEFWRTFTSESLPCSKVPMKGILISCPKMWMLAQLDKNVFMAHQDKQEIVCPQCSSTVGYWEKSCLNIIAPWLPCDLFALHAKSTLYQRKYT